jgi:hypothetical protein
MGALEQNIKITKGGIHMIKKEITLSDGKKYLVGFSEIKAVGMTWVKCYILKPNLIREKIIYTKEYNKGLLPDYFRMAITTIFNYETECKQKEQLLEANWA